MVSIGFIQETQLEKRLKKEGRREKCVFDPSERKVRGGGVKESGGGGGEETQLQEQLEKINRWEL